METPGPSPVSPPNEAPPPVPAFNGITNMDLDKVLMDDWGAEGRKQRIYAQFQEGRSDKEIADFLRDEYLRGGYNDQNSGFVTLADGGRGYSYFVAAELRLSRRDVDGSMRHVKYEEMAAHIRALIDEGRYLTPKELEQIAPAPESEAPPIHVPGGTPPIPASGPMREITQADIDAALQEWNGDADSKRRVQEYMTEHSREKGTADWLRNEYGDDLPAFPVTVEGAATDLPWSKVQRHLARLVKEERFFTEEKQAVTDVEQPAEDAPAPPTVREGYDRYKPIVTNLVLADVPYRNACANSDHEDAVIEGNAAVKRAVIQSGDLELIRLYSDMPEFRQRLHQEVIDETYSQLHELLRPLSQDDVDKTLCAWNGSVDSKQAVVRYMKDHAQEEDTALWLAREYGGENSTIVVRAGSPEEMELPWAEVQRQIAVLIKEDRFFTEQERTQLEQATPPDLSDQPITREGDTIIIGNGDTSHEVEITVTDEEWEKIKECQRQFEIVRKRRRNFVVFRRGG